jgi:hypothetical protein
MVEEGKMAVKKVNLTTPDQQALQEFVEYLTNLYPKRLSLTLCLVQKHAGIANKTLILMCW